MSRRFLTAFFVFIVTITFIATTTNEIFIVCRVILVTAFRVALIIIVYRVLIITTSTVAIYPIPSKITFYRFGWENIRSSFIFNRFG